MPIQTFHHSQFPLERILRERKVGVAVCLPAKEVAATVAPIVRQLMALRESGAIDSVVVIDADSADGTAAIAAAEGAMVYKESDLLPEFGAVQGKGDALWRALSVISEDVVCFVDVDSEDFSSHFVCGLIGPLVCEEGIHFAKGFYRRPFKVGELTLPDGGGRVTELMARPLLSNFYPELAEVKQPLAGEIAARRELLARLPFVCGYGVEIGLLIDVYLDSGPAALAQVDLEQRQNQHQPLVELTSMAATVLKTVLARLQREGRSELAVELLERPPLTSLGQ